MRGGKSISLFFVCGIVSLALGFLAGALLSAYRAGGGKGEQTQQFGEPEQVRLAPQQTEADGSGFLDAASLAGVLASDTEYVLEETDVLRGTVIETSTRLPEKYIGMDREKFLAALERYQASPPLAEKKRGFESLEVLSFSRERVVVRMNYRYVQPGESFYLALQDHKIVVLLEDKKTVYIETEISADVLPAEFLTELIDMVYVEDEASLYDLLEAYSS